MATPHALVISPSARSTPARRAAIEALLPRGLRALHLAADQQPPDVDVRAVVVDGDAAPFAAPLLARLAHLADSAVPLLALAPLPGDEHVRGLLGAIGHGPLPRGEVFVSVRPGHPVTRGLDTEFALDDVFHPLEPLTGDVDVLADVSVHLRDRPAVLQRGRITTCGVGATTAALGEPQLATVLRRCLSTRPVRSPERAIGVGVIGFGPPGGMGTVHGDAVKRTDGLQFVAAAEAQAERRKAAEAQFPDIATYASSDDLLRDDAVDVVVVATPPDSHADLVVRGLRAGRHVVVEKPLCLTYRDARRLISEAGRAGRTLTVHQNRRFDTDFLAVRRAVRQGRLGALFNVETFVGGFAHPCRAWHSERRVSGGAVYDWGAHHLDWILLLYGSMPERVEAVAHKRVWHDVSNADQVKVRLRWADGREAEFVQSDVAAVRRPKFYLQGTAGTLVGHYRPVTLEHYQPGAGYHEEVLHHAEAPARLELASYTSGWGVETAALPLPQPQRDPFHRNLADHLHLGEALAVEAEAVADVVALLEAAQRSVDAGGAPVDPGRL